MTYEELLRDINKGSIAPVYIFVGEEEALKRDALLRIRDKLKADLVFLGEAKDITPNIFGGKMVVVLREFPLKYKEDPSITLVIYKKKMEGEPAPKVSIVSFPKMTGKRLKYWIRERFREKGRAITESAITLLMETCDDISFLIPEIDKIALFCEKSPLTENDILPILSKRFGKDIFSLLDAIGERKIKALSICNELLSQGVSPTYILFMIEKRMEEIFSLKDGIKDPKMKDWQYRRLLNYERLFSSNEAYPIFSNIANCSFKLKSYSSSAKPLILLSLIYHIISKS